MCVSLEGSEQEDEDDRNGVTGEEMTRNLILGMNGMLTVSCEPVNLGVSPTLKNAFFEQGIIFVLRPFQGWTRKKTLVNYVEHSFWRIAWNLGQRQLHF